MLTLHDVCRSRYLLYRNLVDCGFPAARASAAVDVLLDPEVDAEALAFEPDEEDEADYREWGQEVDERWFSDRMARDFIVPEGDNPNYLSDRGRLTDYDILIAIGCVG